jgi:hypothetical protein
MSPRDYRELHRYLIEVREKLNAAIDAVVAMIELLEGK